MICSVKLTLCLLAVTLIVGFCQAAKSKACKKAEKVCKQTPAKATPGSGGQDYGSATEETNGPACPKAPACEKACEAEEIVVLKTTGRNYTAKTNCTKCKDTAEDYYKACDFLDPVDMDDCLSIYLCGCELDDEDYICYSGGSSNLPNPATGKDIDSETCDGKLPDAVRAAAKLVIQSKPVKEIAEVFAKVMCKATNCAV